MKSVFKSVAPIAMTITFALSGVAMADTATAAAKSADSTTVATTETAKPPVHHLHKSKEQKLEQAEAKNTAAPVTTDKPTTTKPAEASKSAESVKLK